MRKFHRLSMLGLIIVQGCAASPKAFYDNPSKVGDTQLCRTFQQAASKNETQLANDTALEAQRRGLTLEGCRALVAKENATIAAVALVGVAAVGVAAACSDGCGGTGSYAPAYRSADYDCRGGTGDGPYYVQGPVYVGGNDPYNLDRDGDGIGCEAGDYGA